MPSINTAAPKPAQYQRHELSEAFGPMGPDQFKELVAGIKVDGFTDTITRYKGQILDGWHRYLACLEAGLEVEPHIKEFTGKDPVKFVIAANMTRRHLDESQRAMAAAKLSTLKHGGKRKGQSAPGHLEVSTEQASALLKTSVRSTKRAKKVLNSGNEEAIKAVESGELKLKPAAEIVSKPKAEQKQALANHLAGKKMPRSVAAPKLNSLSWSEASPAERAKFLDAVGMRSVWEAMTGPMRDAVRELASSNPGNGHDRQVARSDWNYSTAPNQLKRVVQ